MPTITVETLTRRISPELAVDRALTSAERKAFFEYQLNGRYDGAQPADWIAEARNADAFLEHMEPWWERHGADAITYLTGLHQLPDQVTRGLLSAALYASFGLASATINTEPWSVAPRRRTCVEIASAAALWARGYAEALGWTPQ